MTATVFAIACGYLVGSVPFALLVARRSGAPDLRRVGSGNLGAANVLRVAGSGAAALVFVLDAAKGAIPVILVQRTGDGGHLAAAAGLAAVVGHIYPCWLVFRGGKGVATTCGAFAVLAPAAALAAGALFAATVLLTRFVSAGSIVAALALGPAAAVTGAPPAVVTAGVLAGGLVVVRHWTNIARLASGTERRLGRPAGDA